MLDYLLLCTSRCVEIIFEPGKDQMVYVQIHKTLELKEDVLSFLMTL